MTKPVLTNLLGAYLFTLVILVMGLDVLFPPVKGHHVFGGKVEGGKYYLRVEKNHQVWIEASAAQYKSVQDFDKKRLSLVMLLLVSVVAVGIMQKKHPSLLSKHTHQKNASNHTS